MPSQKFYTSTKWRKLRDYKLSINPFCQRCNQIATEVHHIIDRKDRSDLELRFNNLESLCKSCHSKHTYTEIKREWKPYKNKYN
jgi:5-methylcytosine-specific restriction enzyme A